jgi:hypothetical protein
MYQTRKHGEVKFPELLKRKKTTEPTKNKINVKVLNG